MSQNIYDIECIAFYSVKKKKKKPSYKYGKKNVYNNYIHARSLINLEQKKKTIIYVKWSLLLFIIQ